jgi:predicted ATP-grasp superfamily ATP-dependent carboligase
MRKLRVLVTDADTPKSLAIVRALGATHEIWTAASSRLALAAWSRYTRRHLQYRLDDDLGFCDWVYEAGRANQIDIVIPPEESSALLLSREAARFLQSGITIASLPIDALEKVVDKTKTIEAARRIGTRIPDTQIPERNDAVLDAAHRVGYPVVLKPRSTCFFDGSRFISSIAVGYASSDEQVRSWLRRMDSRMPPPIVQEFVPGEGIGVCMLLGAAGEVLAEFAHRRLRDYRPTGSGSVLRESIVLPPRLRDESARLLGHLGCRGVAMVEFRVNPDTGQAYLMEVNGRFWGSLQLAIDAGVNFPALLLASLTGRPVQKPSYKHGVVLRWWAGDFIRTLRVLKGPPPGFAGSFPSRFSAVLDFIGPQPSGTRNEILRRTDCWPSLIEPISMMRRLIA